MDSVLGELSDYHNILLQVNSLIRSRPKPTPFITKFAATQVNIVDTPAVNWLCTRRVFSHLIMIVHVVGHLIMNAWSVTWLCTRGQSLDYVRVVRHLIRHVVSHVIWHGVSHVIWHVFSHVIRNVVSHVIRHVISNLIMYTWSVTWLCTRGQSRDLTRGQSRDEACDLACLDQ